MDLFKAFKDTFKGSASAKDTPVTPDSKESDVSAMYESAAARRIHERNAAFFKSLSGEKVEDTIAEKEAEVPKKDRLLSVLKTQDEILNNMLKEQSRLHKNVKNRNWKDLEKNLENIKNLSDNFVELDSKRESIVGDDTKIYYEKGVDELFFNLRTKLTKSKIENEALRTYVSTTRDFIGNVLEECAKDDNSTYASDGSKVKGDVSSMLVNIEG